MIQFVRAAIISRFEHRVSELNPQMQKVSYTLKDLVSWLDSMVRDPGGTACTLCAAISP